MKVVREQRKIIAMYRRDISKSASVHASCRKKAVSPIEEHGNRPNLQKQVFSTSCGKCRDGSEIYGKIGRVIGLRRRKHEKHS